MEFEETGLWKSTLADRKEGEKARKARERLRVAYLSFRDRSALLAGEIARDLPQFTVHDENHLDALWRLAELVGGDELDLTPTEAFVFGGAVLIHDLGMAVAAYPEGKDSIKQLDIWKDEVVIVLEKQLGRKPTAEEARSPGPEVEHEATAIVLRELHAAHAQELALVSWKDEQSQQTYHLLDDADVRTHYGHAIGQIAHSHWLSIPCLRETLDKRVGALTFCPDNWTVDLLKIACLVRCSDAAHLDERRAPGFLRVLRKPSGDSRKHWVFQEHLERPHRDGDRLVYTAGRPFPIDEADAWWQCYDQLREVDREIREADALLGDLHRSRFAIRAVANVEEPSRLVRDIPTNGWFPIDAKVKVTEIASLIKKLGGGQLYGEDFTVPLRELIQNASDAIQARRVLDRLPADWGDISVCLGKDDGGHWVEVEDTGIGMSAAVLTGPFLDFGVSYWGSDLMIQEYPGLAHKGFWSTGKYGIGFFSVFMWGERVQVRTRTIADARKDTRVLDFRSGLGIRPILRDARPVEYMNNPGTAVRVWLDITPDSPEGLLRPRRDRRQWSLEELCAWLCPGLDANLHIEELGGQRKPTIKANDWLSIPARDLVRRIQGPLPEDQGRMAKQLDEFISITDNVRVLTDSTGRIVGRACIATALTALAQLDSEISEPGVVTVGGLRSSSLFFIAGILQGVPITASRQDAIPTAQPDKLATWASEQAELSARYQLTPEQSLQTAVVVRVLGGETKGLFVAFGQNGWMTVKDIANWKDAPDEVLIIARYAVNMQPEWMKDLLLKENVLRTNPFKQRLVVSSISPAEDWPVSESQSDPQWQDTMCSLEGAIIEALSITWGCTIPQILKASKLYQHWGENRVEVGSFEGRSVKVSADIIRNPKRYGV